MQRVARFLPLFALALGVSACGGTDEGRPTGEREGAVPLDPCEADDGYEFQNLVNFEPRMQGMQTVYTPVCDPFAPCSFYFNYDDAQSPANPQGNRPQGADCTDPVDPDAVAFTQPNIGSGIRSEDIAGGRCSEEQAGLHIVATNVGMCYGPNGRLGWGGAFDITFSPPLDASDWDGIGLWVRNSAPATTALILSVSDPFTSGGAVDPDTNEPYCNATDPPPGAPAIPDSEKCDSFGIAVTTWDEWSFIPASFLAMRQKGFGVPSPNGELDRSTISRVQVLFSAGSWDFWVDNVSLFKAPP